MSQDWLLSAKQSCRLHMLCQLGHHRHAFFSREKGTYTVLGSQLSAFTSRLSGL